MTGTGQDNAGRSGDEAERDLDPPGGHSRTALEDAAEKMHASKESEDVDGDPDPPGGHDQGALEDAAKKMGVER